MPNSSVASAAPLSICVFCGSSDAAEPIYQEAAAALGRRFAESGVRLVYGGGGVGLMGQAARATHQAGGQVLGVMPRFLARREVVYDAVETVMVDTMHQRKQRMFEESDAFAVLPGGIGTLEEVVELISWRRLSLHTKPIVFLDVEGFWSPFFRLIEHTVETRFTPEWTPQAWRSVTQVDAVIPAVLDMIAAVPATGDVWVASKA
jgi:uncharacterized protein (TIGR00730 family)